MTKVDITVAGHIIIVEADEPLEAVAAKALELFRATETSDIVKSMGATGFSAERVGGTAYVAESDAVLRTRV
jgi:hypothetical protein